MAILEVEHINKKFDRTEVLKDISFSLEQGQVLSIIGSSGSGKTTLLRCLNFLETPDVGIIRVNGETLFDAGNEMTKQENEIRKKRLRLDWCSSHLIFSHNIQPWKMSCWQKNCWRRHSRIIRKIKRRSTVRLKSLEGSS